MALVLEDRVRETTSSTGTGPVTLTGAFSGFQPFSIIGDGNTTYYAIIDPTAGDWEVGIGTYTSSGNTLSRDTVLSSSNAGSLVSFAAGLKDVICTQPSERAVYLDSATNATIPGLTLSGGTANGVAFLNGSKVLTTGSALTFDGTQLDIPAGTAALPSLSTTADTNTGIFFPAADTLAASTAGSERLRITSAGNVGIGTSSPAVKLEVLGSSNSNYLRLSGDDASGARALDFTSFTVGGLAGSGHQLNAKAINGTLTFATVGTERMRIDSAGNVGIGTSSPLRRLHAATSSEQAYSTTPGVDDAGISIRAQNLSNTAGTFAGIDLQAGVNTSSAARISVINDTGITNTNSTLTFSVRSSASSNAVTERMRIDSAGNVGIGTSAPGAKLEVSGNSRFLGNGVAPVFWGNTTSIGALSYVGSDPIVQALSSANLLFYGGSNERARIDSSGNLLVGTTVAGSPGLGVSNSTNISFPEAANTSLATMFRQASSGALVLGSGVRYSATANAFASSTSSAWARSAVNVGYGGIKFFTAAEATVSVGTNTTLTERMRIDSSGNLLVGKTSAAFSAVGFEYFVAENTLGLTSTSNPALEVRRYSTNGTAVRFRRDATQVGSIDVTTTATSYVTSSDYRLKEDWQPMTGAITRLNQLKPVNFAWKADGSRVDGFLAHEAQEVVPEAVTGTKDAVDAEGKPEYQGIDQSKLVPLLTAALQEAVAKIAALEARLDAANL